MPRGITLPEIVEFFNKLYAADPNATRALITARFLFEEAAFGLVWGYPLQDTPRFKVTGVLDVINSMFEHFDDGSIFLDTDPDTRELRGFTHGTSMPKKDMAEMTLDEAITHAEIVASRGGACAADHRQLAQWLRRLQELEAAENTNKE